MTSGIEYKRMCFNIDKGLADLFQLSAKLADKTEDEYLDLILINHFAEVGRQIQPSPGIENRQHPRQRITIPAVVELEVGDNEMQYKPVSIVNISCGGVSIEMGSGSSTFATIFDSRQLFVIIFRVPTLSDVYRLACKPVRMTKDAISLVGAAFQECPDSLRNFLSRCLVPSAADHSPR